MSGSRSFHPLSGSRRFEAVLRHGTRVQRGGITIVAALHHNQPPRVGLVAGRRVGGAVARNRAKRRLRAALDQVTLVDGHDYVVIATPAVLTASFAELVRLLDETVGIVTRPEDAGDTR